MTDAIFFRLLADENKTKTLSDSIRNLYERRESSRVHLTSLASLQRVPGSPFAYWVSDQVRRLFREMPPVESHGRVVRLGDHPSDDFRYLRLFWEVPTRATVHDWRPYQKGGDYSTYYYDIYLVADWDESRQTYRGFFGRPGRAAQRPSNCQYFFVPGITWPRRSQRGLSVRVHPRGCMFADKGPVIFADLESLPVLLGLTNSKAFRGLVGLQMAFGSYEVGVIQRTPIPEVPEAQADVLGELALSCVDVKRGFDTANETSHVFHLPALLQAEGATLQERLMRWQGRVLDNERQLAEHQRTIDDIAFQLYGIEGEDRQIIEESSSGGNGAVVSDGDEPTDEEEAATILDGGALVADLLSYSVGCVFGRWDARVALNPSLAPMLADPFAPLPVCSPGMLVGPDGLPASRDGIASEEWMRARFDAITPPPEGPEQYPVIPDSKYPLSVDWDGIIVDDPDHSDDIVRRVRDVLGLLWGENADEMEREACEVLGVKDLQAYFRNPRRFFEHHVKRYSKSRRKAPIYWLLQSPKRNYGLWLYYHRLDPDILFKALMKYVDPKIRLEESQLEEYEARRRSTGAGGREAKGVEKDLAKQEELLTDLREFRERLDRTAKLYLRPDLNDGVVLNAAPLHELLPWKEAKGKWDELLAGRYEWSSIGGQLREKGMV